MAALYQSVVSCPFTSALGGPADREKRPALRTVRGLHGSMAAAHRVPDNGQPQPITFFLMGHLTLLQMMILLLAVQTLPTGT